jgi:predicted TIM-barrel fold metal-dependent hydrolase
MVPVSLEGVVNGTELDFPDLTIVMAHGGRPLWMDAIYASG